MAVRGGQFWSEYQSNHRVREQVYLIYISECMESHFKQKCVTGVTPVVLSSVKFWVAGSPHFQNDLREYNDVCCVLRELSSDLGNKNFEIEKGIRVDIGVHRPNYTLQEGKGKHSLIQFFGVYQLNVDSVSPWKAVESGPNPRERCNTGDSKGKNQWTSKC